MTNDDDDRFGEDSKTDAVRDVLRAKARRAADRGTVVVLGSARIHTPSACIHTRMRILNASGAPPMVASQRFAFPVDSESLMGGSL